MQQLDRKKNRLLVHPWLPTDKLIGSVGRFVYIAAVHFIQHVVVGRKYRLPTAPHSTQWDQDNTCFQQNFNAISPKDQKKKKKDGLSEGGILLPEHMWASPIPLLRLDPKWIHVQRCLQTCCICELSLIFKEIGPTARVKLLRKMVILSCVVYVVWPGSGPLTAYSLK